MNFEQHLSTIENGAIRIGLSLVKGVGPRFARRILSERARGVFSSIENFRGRTGLPEKVIENLFLAGSFTGMAEKEAACG